MVMGPIIDFQQSKRQFLKWEGPMDKFVAAMPEDWQPDFEQYLKSSRDHMELFAITDDDQIVAGGIVFEGLPSEMKIFEVEVDSFIEKGYRYIGFLFVVPEHRKQNLGSTWLYCVKAMQGTNGFWLTVEEPGLREFYEKNGFRWMGTLKKGRLSEELMVFDPVEV